MDGPGENTPKRSAITDDRIFINPKHLRGYWAPNIMHAILTTNHTHAIHAGVRARRWFVCEVDDEHVGDRGYFNALYGDLKSGGYEQFLNALLETDLGDWHPREILRTEELAEQMRMSAGPVEHWFWTAVEIGEIEYTNDRGHPVKIAFGQTWRTCTLFTAFRATSKGSAANNVNLDRFGKTLSRLVGRYRQRQKVHDAYSDGKRSSGFVLPTVEEFLA